MLDDLSRNPRLQILLISFESQPKEVESSFSTNRLKLIILKKHLFLGRWSLYLAVWQLKNILKKHSNFSITARGPVAGYVCAHAMQKKDLGRLTVQARGLLAEEYKFVHLKSSGIKNLIHKIRAHQYKAVEKKVYKNKKINIEAVSPALANYLQNQFGTNKNQISIAKKDIPKTFQPAQISCWKKEIRKKLNIAPTTQVYCFNGSVKPWQCPELVADFFVDQLKKNTDNFLLVLTQNKNEFESLLKTKNIPGKNFFVTTVAHKDIYKHLAACDVGLLFREPHVVNLVSRPTKVLEYQAVGLKVVHNGTVDWVSGSTSQARKEQPTLSKQ